MSCYSSQYAHISAVMFSLMTKKKVSVAYYRIIKSSFSKNNKQLLKPNKVLCDKDLITNVCPILRFLIKDA